MEFGVCEEAPNLGPGAAKRLKLSAFDENQCEQAPVNIITYAVSNYGGAIHACCINQIRQKKLQKARFHAKEEGSIKMMLTWRN